MVRNNGRPEGTGEGKSIPVALDDQLFTIADAIGVVQDSDPKSKGAILQPFVGQFLFDDKDGKHYAPIFSGIAYTAKASERGNVVLEWVFGHPKAAVVGQGRYIAFNEQNWEQELGDDTFFYKQSMKDSWALEDSDGLRGRSVGIRPIAGGWQNKMTTFINREEVFSKIPVSILNFGEHGAFYLEWAATCIKSKTRLFALQVAETEHRIAGIPTWLKDALDNMSGMIQDALFDTPVQIEALNAYRKAVEDPQVIAAGFDVVGRGKLEFEKMVWMPNVRSLNRCHLRSAWTLAFNGKHTTAKLLTSYDYDKESLAGIVEIVSSRKERQTFRGHMHGFCTTRGILGLGGIENMGHKLYASYPEKFAGTKHENLLIKGKFVLEVDEGMPFGTLRVERVDSVQKL